MTASAAVAAANAAAIDREKSLQDELTLPILLTDRLIKAAAEAESSRQECSDISRQANDLSVKLRATVRLTSSSHFSNYDRPIRRIAADTSKNLDRALSLVRKCKHSGLLRHVFLTITSSAADFKKVTNLLESSIADFRWLLSIINERNDDNDNDCDMGGNLSIPPVASNDPILAWVWSSIFTLQASSVSRNNDSNRFEAANSLASWARNNVRYRKVIVEECAVPPLLRLLKDGGAEGQVAAATALFWLADGDVERCRVISAESGVQVIVQVLGDSPMNVQIAVAELVGKISEIDHLAREQFGRENVLKPLISCLVMELDMDEYKRFHSGGGKTSLSLHSIVQTAKNRNYNYSYSSNGSSNGGSVSSYSKMHSSSSLGYSKKDRENESPEVKLKLKTRCAMALWRLCERSLLNSQKIAEAKGLFCLSKIIETEQGELQFNCLMTVMVVAEVAESNADLRKAAWKPSSAPAKAVLDQLLRVIKEETNVDFQIPAIKAIGCLARIFPAKETGVVSSLVSHLGNANVNVATEAVFALTKFAAPDNHNGVAHSKTIIEFNGVPLLMKLLSASERAKMHGLFLLCYLSMHVGNSKALEEARALRTLEGAIRSGLAQNADLRETISKAIHHLMVYQDGSHPHSHSFAIV